MTLLNNFRKAFKREMLNRKVAEFRGIDSKVTSNPTYDPYFEAISSSASIFKTVK